MSYSNRVLIIYTVAAVLLSLGVLAKFSQLMLGQVEPSSGVSQTKVQTVRGSIFDRNGRLLASQIKRKSLEAWLPSMKDPRHSANILAPMLGLEVEKLYRRFVESERKYLWVKRFLSQSEAENISVYIARGELPGLKLREEYKRYYPLGQLASHLVGFTNIDNIGLAGVERSMEGWLNPQSPQNIGPNGLSTWRQNTRGRLRYGNKVYLSIDLDTQYIIDKIARKAMIDTQADSLVALLMDARNGALVAFVSLPEYDPNLFNRYSPEILSNQAISTAYEPGSVFKIYTMAAMLDEGVVSVDQIFDISVIYDPPIFQDKHIQPIRDVTPHGALSATEVLIYSSNVGMATATEGIRSQVLYDKLRHFGFGKTTGIQLPGESNGIFNSPRQWSIRSKPTIAFGQEIGVSAIQMVRAATAFTNGGMLLAPIIIDRIEEPDGTVRLKSSRQPEYEVISPVTAKNMLLMMEQVVASDLGTMRGSRVPGLRISGKSGTAQVINPRTRRYYPERVNSSAISIFPTDDPRFILYVNIFNPKSAVRYGGRLISPMVAEAVSELTTHYNLPLQGNRIAYFNEGVESLIQRQLSKKNDPTFNQPLTQVPDLTGLSKRKLLPLLRTPGLMVEILGEGHVISQSLAPGTPIQSASAAENTTENRAEPIPASKVDKLVSAENPSKLDQTKPPLPNLELKVWLQ